MNKVLSTSVSSTKSTTTRPTFAWFINQFQIIAHDLSEAMEYYKENCCNTHS